MLEEPLRADFAFVRAHRADRLGNLVYRRAQRNFGPVMCMAARTTIVEVDEILPCGALDPDVIVTPSLFVHRLLGSPQ
ncbi:3-oxoadipate CoA-transferase subunit A [compost metagenome]